MPDFNLIEPLDAPGICDYHCHCDFSMDAEGSIDEYCQAALARNLAELCFTTHYDTNYAVDYSDNYIRVNGKRVQANPENLKYYVEAVNLAMDKYYAYGLSVKLGLEFGWYEGCEESALKLKEQFPFDYFLCGMHQLDNLCFWGHGDRKGNFDYMSLKQFAEAYFKQVVNAASSGLFNSLAHLDYYRYKGIAHYGPEANTIHASYLKEVFSALKKSGTGLEINTAAEREGLKGYYPQMTIINEAKKEGVKVVRLGSDAHSPEEVGYDFEIATALIPSTIVSCED